MARCPIDLVDAAAEDRLADDKVASLQSHLSRCKKCCARLDSSTASPIWWNDASRLLDDSLLDDPPGDIADSSTADARLFEDDDPVGELKAAGIIDSPSHPEMLGQLGRYAIERELGSGGMGVVLKGFDAELNRTVAIKVLAPHLARSAAARQRFIREGRAAAAVVHENIVAIHEVDTSGRLPTLVMHCVDGVSLQRHVDTIGPLPVCDALRIASQTAAGLTAAHRQGIIHRDVKPANILIGGGGQRVWITDFGLARAVDDASLTRTGFIAGTPHYMSPEQARGGPVGPESDLFSLGSVIYFMLAARPPWRAERSLAVLHRIVGQPHRPLWQVNSDVPREVSDLVDDLLAKTTDDRVESATKAQERLEEMLAQMQNPNGPHSLSHGNTVGDAGRTSPSKQRWYKKPIVVAPATAAATLLLVNQFGWTDVGRFIIGPHTANPPSTVVNQNKQSRQANGYAPVKPDQDAAKDAAGDVVALTFQPRTSKGLPIASKPILATRPAFGTLGVGQPPSMAQAKPTTSSTNSAGFSTGFDRPTATGGSANTRQSNTTPTMTLPVRPNEPNSHQAAALSTTPDNVWRELSQLETLLRQAEFTIKPSIHNQGNQP